ncbi:hypothetical protein ACFP2T_43410 [Plantactinospora solaniradicis]|uniref:Glycosyltransferase n=1 Tax=Plantactinospora solaniradicis TaxID=1723736 RepID=A0ABW1KPY4_9ACTN
MQAFRSTVVAETSVLLILDDEDPNLGLYQGECTRLGVSWTVQTGHNLITGLNFGYKTLPEDVFAVGFMGDDHRPRSVGWDRAYLDALRDLRTGVVYGNDLLQGEALPTQVAMTVDIPREVGFFAPETLIHLYCDNYWKDLGSEAGCLRYLPEVVVEHCHPAAGKAEWDEGHLRVNRHQSYVRDGRAYREFVATGGLQRAVETVKRLREP